MKLFKRKAKVDWNLDYEFICWLDKHLKEYRKNAGEWIDLDFHKFTYKYREYTQRELIELLLEDTNYLKDNYYNINIDDGEVREKVDEMLVIFKLIFPSLWW